MDNSIIPKALILSNVPFYGCRWCLIRPLNKKSLTAWRWEEPLKRYTCRPSLGKCGVYAKGYHQEHDPATAQKKGYGDVRWIVCLRTIFEARNSECNVSIDARRHSREDAQGTTRQREVPAEVSLPGVYQRANLHPLRQWQESVQSHLDWLKKPTRRWANRAGRTWVYSTFKKAVPQ